MVARRSFAARVAAVALFATAGLTSCGSDQAVDPAATGTSPTEAATSEPTSESSPEEGKTAPEGTPTCSSVWQDGAKIPRFYKGCTEGDDYVQRDALTCSSGQRSVRYADRYYGVLGGTVHEATQPLDEDRDYRRAVRRCRA